MINEDHMKEKNLNCNDNDMVSDSPIGIDELIVGETIREM